MKSKRPRRGYAMLLTLVFLALMLSMYSVAYRQIAAQLRSETALAKSRQRDEGSIRALARGVALLETGVPPSSVYVCSTTVNTSDGPRSFELTIRNEGVDSEGRDTWSVQAAPTASPESVDPLPTSFDQSSTL